MMVSEWRTEQVRAVAEETRGRICARTKRAGAEMDAGGAGDGERVRDDERDSDEERRERREQGQRQPRAVSRNEGDKTHCEEEMTHQNVA